MVNDKLKAPIYTIPSTSTEDSHSDKMLYRQFSFDIKWNITISQCVTTTSIKHQPPEKNQGYFDWTSIVSLLCSIVAMLTPGAFTRYGIILNFVI